MHANGRKWWDRVVGVTGGEPGTGGAWKGGKTTKGTKITKGNCHCILAQRRQGAKNCSKQTRFL
jgi:hypothetical protein